LPRPRKQLGQHFLTDPRILARIADAAAVQAGDTVLEIGPGPGGLTAELARRAGHVFAIETDRELAARLVSRWSNVTVVTGDALRVDWHSAAGIPAGARSPVPGYRIVGNIPYNITTPLIDRALAPPRPALVAFLVQREVAERVAARPGTRVYGALSVGVQAVADVDSPFRVAAGAFTPPPQVDSALLRLVPRASPLLSDGEVIRFRRLVVGLFGLRRKQLLRGLREFTGFTGEQLSAVLAALGFDPTTRPERLTPAEFAALYGALVDGGWGGD
jgi:16S rRNA (adenine1518-N6/adenine1519-N6)-dimethyltransferase